MELYDRFNKLFNYWYNRRYFQWLQFGIGGGIVIIPALVYLIGFSQLKAQGTSLDSFSKENGMNQEAT